MCAERVTELLGFEDEVVIEYVFGQLEAGRVSWPRSTWTSLGCPASAPPSPRRLCLQFPDAKAIQINLTGFMEHNTSTFMGELWEMLVSAQSNIGRVPSAILEAKNQ